ncbi:MAG: Protease 3 precursor [Planctomycetes bacterium ADurb.Bin126]|nr:MAG: Protease 3 precursor [Planctomycetes bacterium ADurb.Bin126]HQL72474.1 pitrilysin family protein [Phycisphaerae bacterium]
MIARYALAAAMLVCGLLTPSLVPAAEPPAATTRPAPASPEMLDVTALVQHAQGAVVAKLSNGLTVIIKPVRSSPVVTVSAHVQAGGLYEGQWLGCGLSHLLEHLVAKGAVTDDEGGPARSTRPTIEAIGGQSNAYTSLDHTMYYISAAATQTSACVDLIADWMVNAEIRKEDFEREHGVVQRELEMGKDNPDRQIWYAHSANVYAGHPAAVPVIGFMDPLRRVTLEDVKSYHALMYASQNMVFVVAGDVDVDGALEQVRRAFAPMPRGRAVRHDLPPVRPLAGVSRIVHPHPALQETLQHMSFLTIPLVHGDLYALDVLDELLTGGASSRLVEKVQRQKKLVTSVASSSWTPAWGTGSFAIMFRSAADKADQAEQAILDELKLIIKEGVDAAELQRAKRRKTAAYVHSQQTVESIAETLASDYMATGDIDFSRNYTNRIQAVTGEQVQKAAGKYFTFDRMAITRMVPASKFASAEAAAQRKEAGRPETFTLDNGLRVVLAPNDAVGLVSMAMVTKGGLMVEDAQTNGLGSLTMSLSTKGAAGRSARQIAEFFDEAGGSVRGACGSNSFYWQATVLEDRFDKALEVFADIVVRPDFTKDELEILRPILIDAAKQVDEEWSTQSRKFFFGKFFEGSPYALMPTGRIEVLQKATVEQVREHYRRTVHAGSSCLAIYGKFDPKAAREKIRTFLGKMPGGQVVLPTVAPRTVKKGGERYVLPTRNKVAAIMVGHPGLTVHDVKERLALNVLDTIISGYQLPAGWLHEELRGKQLVYVVHAYNWPGLAPGAFLTYAACQPEQAANVVGIIEKQLTRAASYTPTQAEIDRAVNTIATAEILDNQEMSSLALSAALDETYDLGYDFRQRMLKLYREIAPADVAAAGKKYLSPPYVVTVTTPKPDVVEK